MGFDALTIAVAVVVLAATLAIGWRRPFAVLAFLVLAIPFRDFATRWMNVHTGLSVSQVTAIGRWWFALIGSLLALALVRWAAEIWTSKQLPKFELADIALAVCLVLAAVHTLASPARSAAFLSFRGYVQPLGVYFLARLIRPSRQAIGRLVWLWLAVGVFIASFGIAQFAAWDEQTYQAEGYVRQGGQLVVPYAELNGRMILRPASTVSGPNELGMDMVVMALLASFLASSGKGKLRIALVGAGLVLIAGLAVSVSRSALLALVAGGLAAGVLIWRQIRSSVGRLSQRSRRLALSSLFGIAAAVVLLLAATGLLSLVVQTIGRLSTAYHTIDTLNAVKYLFQHPQGVGMGLVEPKGALALIEAGGVYHVEGSLFQIAFEMGVWGLATWMAFWVAALVRIWRNWQALTSVALRALAGAAFAGWIGSLVAFLFLPLMQSISLMAWLWFLLGIGYSSSRFEAAWSLQRS